MRKIFIAAALLAAPTSTFAQTSAPLASETVDPAHLALAKEVIDHIWPLGTAERVMGVAASEWTDAMMASMFDLKMGDFPVEEGEEPLDPEMAEATLREAILEEDPHFEERLRITNQVMMREMGPVMGKVEPQIRDAMAKAYARRFSAGQLSDLDRFFDTPTGSSYASEMMMVHMDPEIMAATSAMMPELLKQMPEIMKKVEAATAHLPPPLEAEDDEESSD